MTEPPATTSLALLQLLCTEARFPKLQGRIVALIKGADGTDQPSQGVVVGNKKEREGSNGDQFLWVFLA